jgi:hypothetical protein
MDDESEVTELIELLGDEYNEALLGCVYDEDGTPVPCYSSAAVMQRLVNEGYEEDEALEAVEAATDGMRLLWIHELELSPEFSPDSKPHLRLVH